ncbi:MAG: thiamine phosphate synthase [Chitinophagaceae bacterium]|nr:thiamine phosphate synthase [Oligoflexus sp.]
MNEQTVWSLAGHDPFSGAGIHADIRTAAGLGVTLRTLLTSLTAQNDRALIRAEALDVSWLKDQWDALRAMEKPAAIKVGLLLKSETVRWLSDTIDSDIPMIVDPVFAASSGGSFFEPGLLENLREFLFKRIDLLTPNRPEAEAIVGFPIRTLADLQKAAVAIRGQGVKAVYIKGGHGDGDELIDYFDDGLKPFILRSRRFPGDFRGTGCTLSTAIAAGIAQGLDLRDASVAAHAYVHAAIGEAFAKNTNHLSAVAHTPALQPLSYDDAMTGKAFAPLTRSLGFYPVLPNVEWIARLAGSGVKTLQLRAKDQGGSALKDSVLRAKSLCEANDISLFVNDAWELAIECQVYGVHLGQEDLDALSLADLDRIRISGLRLGISTHSLEEAARALSLQPSYIALGPVFETTCKSMRFGPQGISRVGEWVKRLPNIPVVAIGGLKLEHTAAIHLEGADSIAVISDLTHSDNPEQRMNEWLKAWGA